MTYDISTLTENQILLLNGIADAQFSEGPDFGAWYDDVVTQAFEKGIIKTKQQTKATLNQLIRKGVLTADTTKEEGSTWITLSIAGGDALSALADDESDVPDETEILAVLNKDDVKAEAAALEEEEEEDLLGDTGAIPIVPVPEKKLSPRRKAEIAAGFMVVAEAAAKEEEEDEFEDLLGVEAALTETIADSVVAEQVVTHTENYKVNEWKDAEDTEWTETIFADGSHTLKRRREVSGSWRTDYWGAEFSGDKERATTATQAKIARAVGHFNHVKPKA